MTWAAFIYLHLIVIYLSDYLYIDRPISAHECTVKFISRSHRNL